MRNWNVTSIASYKATRRVSKKNGIKSYKRERPSTKINQNEENINLDKINKEYIYTIVENTKFAYNSLTYSGIYELVSDYSDSQLYNFISNSIKDDWMKKPGFFYALANETLLRLNNTKTYNLPHNEPINQKSNDENIVKRPNYLDYTQLIVEYCNAYEKDIPYGVFINTSDDKALQNIKKHNKKYLNLETDEEVIILLNDEFTLFSEFSGLAITNKYLHFSIRTVKTVYFGIQETKKFNKKNFKNKILLNEIYDVNIKEKAADFKAVFRIFSLNNEQIGYIKIDEKNDEENFEALNFFDGLFKTIINKKNYGNSNTKKYRNLETPFQKFIRIKKIVESDTVELIDQADVKYLNALFSETIQRVVNTYEPSLNLLKFIELLKSRFYELKLKVNNLNNDVLKNEISSIETAVTKAIEKVNQIDIVKNKILDYENIRYSTVNRLNKRINVEINESLKIIRNLIFNMSEIEEMVESIYKSKADFIINNEFNLNYSSMNLPNHITDNLKNIKEKCSAISNEVIKLYLKN